VTDPLDAWLAQEDFPDATLRLLGTLDPDVLRRRADSWCRSSLGAGVEEVFFFHLSVSAAYGIRLADGRLVLLKAYPPGREAGFVTAVQRVQSFLAARAFPCPRPLAAPAPFGDGVATAEEWREEGEEGDPHRPEIRHALASCLAELVRLTEPFRGDGALARGFTILDEDLWGEPHSPIFDFGATAAGAGWIDAAGREARELLASDPSPVVVGHTDWSVKHFRFAGARILVIHDWESLMRVSEAFLVGTAAAHFTARPPTWRPPSSEEGDAFAAEYERARGAAFTPGERRAVEAARRYGTAYTARCEHSLDPEGERFPGSFRDALQRLTGRSALALGPDPSPR
jgi:hypothetical protein